MAAKKKAKKTARKAAAKVQRKCSECGKKGHNQRSHQPGGRLAR